MILSILLVVLLFSLLVFIHELGHFWAARRSGVVVEEFGLGFPPRIISRQVGQTKYSLNLLPLGGFVRLKGEDGQDNSSGSFSRASYRHKAKILLAGVGMNLILAYLVLVALAATGMPPVIEGQFKVGNPHYVQAPALQATSVSAGSPAAAAGIKTGDLLLRADTLKLERESQLFDFTRQHAGQEVVFEIKDGQQARQVSVKLRDKKLGADQGYLGVVPLETSKLSYGWWAPLAAAGILVQLVWGTLSAFGSFIWSLLPGGPEQAAAQVTGPVGIVSLLSYVIDLGLAYFWVFVASISISLAVINALPLPALDGGRLALLTVGKISRRPLSPQKEALVHTIGFVLLIALMVAVTYLDVKRLG